MSEVKEEKSKMLCKRKKKTKKKEKNNQVLMKNKVKFFSAVGYPSDFFLDLPLVFSQLQVQGGFSNFWQHCLYLLPLPLEGASGVIERVRSLSLLWEALFHLLGKLRVHFPCL